MCVHNIYNFYPNRMARHTKNSSRRKNRRSRVRGAGYMTGPQSAYPGGLVYNSYSGPQTDFSPMKDCTGNPMSLRTGYIADYTPRGLPYGTSWKGGKRGRKRGGATMPPPAPMADLGDYTSRPVYSSVPPLPRDFPNPGGIAGSVGDAQVVAAARGGVIPHDAGMAPGASTQVIPKQSGGRWTSLFGPLNEESGIGTTPGQFGRIPCEAGTYNPLNRNPGNVQGITTAPLTPPYVTMPPMNTMRGMRGGDMNLSGAPIQLGSGADFSRANFPMVDVGSRDAMRYYAPTAGYGHDFQTFKAPSPVPALMLNTGYDARAFNPACIKTGGSRKNGKNKRRFRGGSFAADAAPYSSFKWSEAETRRDFDGSNKALPCQAAGSRKKRRSCTRRSRTRRTRRSRSRHTRRK